MRQHEARCGRRQTRPFDMLRGLSGVRELLSLDLSPEDGALWWRQQIAKERMRGPIVVDEPRWDVAERDAAAELALERARERERADEDARSALPFAARPSGGSARGDATWHCRARWELDFEAPSRMVIDSRAPECPGRVPPGRGRHTRPCTAARRGPRKGRP